MSYTRKILDDVRSGLNTVLDRVAVDDAPLSHVDEVELAAELEDRRAARKTRNRAPGDNPLAKLAGAGDAAAAQRARLAEKREGRIRGERERKAAARQRAQDDAFRRMKEEAARGARTTGGTRARTGPSGGHSRAGGFPFKPRNDKIAEYYKVLDLPNGAPFPEVKAAYRKLMRKYHPDRHAGNPKKQKAATELTMRVTQAYNELEQHLNGK